MKNWQEKAGSRGYQKTRKDLWEEKRMKHMWKEMVNTKWPQLLSCASHQVILGCPTSASGVVGDSTCESRYGL